MLGRFLCILRNICILWGFSYFICCHPALYSCGCGPYGIWSIFVELGGAVIAKLTGRGSGNFVVFIFLFLYAVLCLVLVPRYLWSWRCLQYPRHCPTGIVFLMVAVAPTVGSSSSPDGPCPPNILAPSLSFDILPRLMWRVFVGRCRWNLHRGCDCICILIQYCGG